MARRAEYGVVVEWIFCSEWCASGVLGLGVEVWRSGVLEYLRTYSVLLRFGGDGTLISSNAGVSRTTHQDTPGHPRTRRGRASIGPPAQGQGIVSESRKGGRGAGGHPGLRKGRE